MNDEVKARNGMFIYLENVLCIADDICDLKIGVRYTVYDISGFSILTGERHNETISTDKFKLPVVSTQKFEAICFDSKEGEIEYMNNESEIEVVKVVKGNTYFKSKREPTGVEFWSYRMKPIPDTTYEEFVKTYDGQGEYLVEILSLDNLNIIKSFNKVIY